MLPFWGLPSVEGRFMGDRRERLSFSVELLRLSLVDATSRRLSRALTRVYLRALSPVI